MSAFDALAACAGSWRGTNLLYYPPNEPPAASPSEMTVTPLLGGRFVRLAYTWAFGDQAHEGEMLVGHVPKESQASMHWIDTFHYGRKVLALTGATEDGAPLSVRGSYPAPPGPDWGWRITVETAEAGKALRIVMYNIEPDGPDDIAVEMAYTPA